MQSNHVVRKTPSRFARRKAPVTTWRLFGVWLMMAIAGIAGTAAHAALPPAGTTIGNQAAATYTDSNGGTRNATSNKVITIIQQVASLTLVADRTKQGAPNGPVYFPHTVKNTGNGADSYDLTAVEDAQAAAGTFPVDQIVIYADLNGDGIPDNFTPIAVSPTLAAGESFSFIVAGHVPSTATTGQMGEVEVKATSTYAGPLPYTAPSATNDDTVTVTPNAIIDITKAIDNSVGASRPTSGSPAHGTTHSYTLNYENRGVGAASTVTITDVIDTNLYYVSGTGIWNTKVLTDAAGGDPTGISYKYDSGTNTITATIANVSPGENGSISFSVNVKGDIAPQVIPNTANYIYNDGVGTVAIQPTNTVNLTINPTLSVMGTSPAAQGPVAQGSTLYFDNVFKNTGTGTDTYDVTINSVTSTKFPVGTTFKLYQPRDNTNTAPKVAPTAADVGAPLLDSNGNNIPDTGPVAPGASYNVYLQVTLPASAADLAGAYTVEKTATSITDPIVKVTVTDALNGITPSTVDLKNPSGATNSDGTSGTSVGDGAGQGPGSGTNIITTLSGDPGSTLTFNLSVTNSSTNPDNYDLLASGTNAFSPTTGLPGGATVVFTSDQAGTSVITNTGNVGVGATKLFYAQVKIPANVTPFTASGIYFRAKSPNSGAEDTKLDAIIANAVRAITITPDHTGQTYPGSSIVYTHTVTNNSNTTETISLVSGDTSAGFTSLIYLDTDTTTPGVLTPNDPQYSGPITLAPGASQNIFVKVFAPANAVPGNVDVATVTGTTTASPSVLTAFATDTTTVVSGQLTLLKEQALDADLNGAPDIVYGTDIITTGALPGKGIRYRITVTNNSALPITNVIVNDSTPPYTAYFEPTGATTAGATSIASWTKDGGATYTTGAPIPANNGTGVLVFSIGTLNPGQSAIVYFGVQINQ